MKTQFASPTGWAVTYERESYRHFDTDIVDMARLNLNIIKKILTKTLPKTLNEIYKDINNQKHCVIILKQDLKEVLECLEWAGHITYERGGYIKGSIRMIKEI